MNATFRRLLEADPLCICPGVEPFLHADGTLYFLPVPGREQLQIQAPFGGWLHEFVIAGTTPLVPVAEQQTFVEVVDYLHAEGYVRPAAHIFAEDTALHDRQVRWFGQEGADGPDAQRLLAAKTVLVLGVGGLGGAVADLLARSGVGHLVLLDFDIVEHANMPRQVLYDTGDVNHPKIVAAARRLQAVAPAARIDTVSAHISQPETVAQLIRRYDIDLVVCAIDRPAVMIKGIVEQGALPLGVPVIHGGHRPPNAYVGPFSIPGGDSACYDCFHAATVAPENDEVESALSFDRDANPLQFPAVVWGDVTAAALMVAQIVPWLAGIHDTVLAGREIEIDMRTLTTRWIDPVATQRCDLCRAHDHAELHLPEPLRRTA